MSFLRLDCSSYCFHITCMLCLFFLPDWTPKWLFSFSHPCIISSCTQLWSIWRCAIIWGLSSRHPTETFTRSHANTHGYDATPSSDASTDRNTTYNAPYALVQRSFTISRFCVTSVIKHKICRRPGKWISQQNHITARDSNCSDKKETIFKTFIKKKFRGQDWATTRVKKETRD